MNSDFSDFDPTPTSSGTVETAVDSGAPKKKRGRPKKGTIAKVQIEYKPVYKEGDIRPVRHINFVSDRETSLFIMNLAESLRSQGVTQKDGRNVLKPAEAVRWIIQQLEESVK